MKKIIFFILAVVGGWTLFTLKINATAPSFSSSFPSCTLMNTDVLNIQTSYSSNTVSDCYSAPDAQYIKFYKAALCTSQPTPPTATAAADTSSCQFFFSSAAGQEISVVKNTLVTFASNAVTAPPPATYSYLYLEIDPTFGVVKTQKFGATVRGEDGSTGTTCWSLDTTVYSNHDGTLVAPVATSCGAVAGTAARTKVAMNSLNGSYGATGFLNQTNQIPTSSVDQNSNPIYTTASLIDANGLLVQSEAKDTLSNVKRVSGIMKLAGPGVTITSSTTQLAVGYNNSLGVDINLNLGTAPRTLQKFGSGPFDVTLSAN